MPSAGFGAAWQHGGLPPWMEPGPGFDEADAADRHELLTERFGDLRTVTAERPAAPPAPRRRDPAADDTPEDYARRRQVLCDALDPPSPLANLGQWAA